MTSNPEHLAAFVSRHVGPRESDLEHMLQVVGKESLDDLMRSAIPESILTSEPLDIEPAPSESDVLLELRELANRNTVRTSLIGMGYYGTVTPPVILRKILENPAWYTAYTPYQPEISQGRLEALLNFQTVVSDLTALPVAGASLLDEATAAAEAIALMSRSARRAEAPVVLVDTNVHVHSLAVMRTRATAVELEVVTADLSGITTPDELKSLAGERDLVGIVVQYPDTRGEVRDLRTLAQAAHDAGALVTACTDLLALTVLAAPGEWGADIAVGSSQRFGVSMGFGGPHAGFMSVRKGLERSMPGRLVGVSVDTDGHPAYRLALQTREQHIRREKATSNICTAQVLLAVMASMYAVWHGPEGLVAIGRRVNDHARRLRDALVAGGVEVVTEQFFDTLTVRPQGGSAALVDRAKDAGLLLWAHDEEHVSLSLDETTDDRTLARICEVFGVERAAAAGSGESELTWPQELERTSEFLTHPVFHSHRSETAMLRYLRSLSNKDFALDRGMIPLGSCTMKLNATTEMESITWPEFAFLHPFAPAEDSEGIRELIRQLSDWLCEVTGYDAVSLQPNAGAQGEFAGLLAIHAYHQARGEGHRRVCLIPASAHGTNAASAVMAGMRVVVVKTDTSSGNIDMDDLRAKVEQHRDELSAIMVTYPSTHGVYEDTITELCELVHDAGGQVYVDGANLNALVGWARPGKFGADVSHLNLHKTFCIPHGGGGPGVGPVAVRQHLAPHLPNHPLAPECGPETGPGPVSAAPYGSANILPISWAYVRLMGGEGLKRATEMAVLGANYIAARLRQHYPVLYSGADGLVAHECILDLRGITAETGVTVDDVAKRLIDYGFHAPTMSFPVAGTLMVEPTESENLYELDRFCDAMIAIRDEIEAVHKGDVELATSALRQAPHTAYMLAGEWDLPYERMQGAFPTGNPENKYWPPVRRIDGAYGDRNLVCSCPPIEDLAE